MNIALNTEIRTGITLKMSDLELVAIKSFIIIKIKFQNNYNLFSFTLHMTPNTNSLDNKVLLCDFNKISFSTTLLI